MLKYYQSNSKHTANRSFSLALHAVSYLLLTEPNISILVDQFDGIIRCALKFTQIFLKCNFLYRSLQFYRYIVIDGTGSSTLYEDRTYTSYQTDANSMTVLLKKISYFLVDKSDFTIFDSFTIMRFVKF